PLVGTAGPTPVTQAAGQSAQSEPGAGQANGKRITVRSQISGIISDLHGRERDKVQKGDILIRLDDRRAKRDVEQAQEEMRKAKADPTPPKAALDQLAVKLRKARAFLAQHEVRSPVDGTVVVLFRRTGDAIRTSEPLLEIEADR